MIEYVAGGAVGGTVTAPPSKSHFQRILICSALSDGQTVINNAGFSDDINTIKNCLDGVLCDITENEGSLTVTPIEHPGKAVLNCNESGVALRFLLPLFCVLGIEAVFVLGERLCQRPIMPLVDTLNEGGARVTIVGNTITVHGKLTERKYSVTGDISSQFVSGMLLSLPLLGYDTALSVIGKTSSRPYIEQTLAVAEAYGAVFAGKYNIKGIRKYTLPPSVTVEGDWSNAAFFLALGAYSEAGITVNGLNTDTKQGDVIFLRLLEMFGAAVSFNNGITVKCGRLNAITFDADNTPDAVMPAVVLAACAKGETVIKNVSRLRDKESDRIDEIICLLSSFGIRVEFYNGDLHITGGTLSGNVSFSSKDHRIIMLAACLGKLNENGITIKNAEYVNKSFPDFFEILKSLEIKP